MKIHLVSFLLFFVDFWFNHCNPCISQFPEYSRIYDSYHNKGFIMTGISIDSSVNDIQAWKSVIKTKKLPWIQYLDKKVYNANELRISYFPSNFLLDNTGKIIAKNIEPFQLENFLKQGLN